VISCNAALASASRDAAAGRVPEPMASGAMPRERGSAAAFFLRRGFPSLLLGAFLVGLGSATDYLVWTGPKKHEPLPTVPN